MQPKTSAASTSSISTTTQETGSGKSWTRFPTSSGPLRSPVTKNGADKGAGLLWLADHLGVPVEETVAFGDSSNDIAMLKAAGDGVAVANARPECLAAADQSAQSNDKGGVGLYMEELLRRQ